MIDLTAIDLTAKTTVELRKIGSAAGLKGASKGRKGDLLSDLSVIRNEQIDAIEKERAIRTATSDPKPQAAPAGKCTECGRKLKKGEFGGLCEADRTYGEWENTHGDNAHEGNSAASEAEEIAHCPVCHPELDPRKPKLTSRSRLGMVIVAKGTELHKSATFKKAAEAIGWIVEITIETIDVEEDGETFQIERHVAAANRGDDAIKLAWDGRAYDYPSSFAVLAGKSRKVRNLKEALRFLAR